MPPEHRRARTDRSADFAPDTFFEQWALSDLLPKNNDFQSSITSAFNLSKHDTYVYRAITGVTLSQVQEAIAAGSHNRLHAWYLDDDGEPVEYNSVYPDRIDPAISFRSADIHVATTAASCRYHRVYRDLQFYKSIREGPGEFCVQRKEELTSSSDSFVLARASMSAREVHCTQDEEAASESVLRLLDLVLSKPRVGGA